MLGDLNIAEPGALIGFAGPRVIEQTIRQKLPEGFQRSEFLLEHGMLDAVVHRKQTEGVHFAGAGLHGSGRSVFPTCGAASGVERLASFANPYCLRLDCLAPFLCSRLPSCSIQQLSSRVRCAAIACQCHNWAKC